MNRFDLEEYEDEDEDEEEYEDEDEEDKTEVKPIEVAPVPKTEICENFHFINAANKRVCSLGKGHGGRCKDEIGLEF